MPYQDNVIFETVTIAGLPAFKVLPEDVEEVNDTGPNISVKTGSLIYDVSTYRHKLLISLYDINQTQFNQIKAQAIADINSTLSTGYGGTSVNLKGVNIVNGAIMKIDNKESVYFVGSIKHYSKVDVLVSDPSYYLL